MDALTDTLARHGVLAADKKPGSETTPLDKDTISEIKVGDHVVVRGSSWTEDGAREVVEMDLSDDSSSVKILNQAGQRWWIDNDHIFGFIKKHTQEVSVVRDNDAYLRAKIGDTVRIEGSDSVTDGNYRVTNIDEGDSMRLKVDDHDGGAWVYNTRVMSIVTSATEADLTVYQRAKVGDTIRVGGYSDYKAGNYVVVTVEPEDYDGDYNLEVRLSDRPSHTTWVRNKDVLEIVTSVVSAPAVASMLAYQQAKVGDTIRVSRGDDHTAGDFVVTSIQEGYRYSRLAVNYPPEDARTWWIRNERVEAVVTKSMLGSAVRGNCLIHVDVPTIMANRSNNRHDPVIVARRLSSIGTVEKFRELAWDGPSRFVHHHFQRIEGTDVQNWVETDAPLTAWKPDGSIDVINPVPGTMLDDMRAMTKPILGAFVIHIAAPKLASNRRDGRNDPVIAVRKVFTNWATDVVFARKVEWNGPSRMVHRPSTPIPGTEGRGVSFVETDASVTVYLDNEEPIVLTMPPLRAAA